MKFLYSVEYYAGKTHLKSIGIRAVNLDAACATVRAKQRPRNSTSAKVTSASGTEYAEVYF